LPAFIHLGLKDVAHNIPSKAIATFVSCRGRCRMYGEVMCISLYNIPRFLFSVYDWLTP
jgi:hypothetical protein